MGAFVPSLPRPGPRVRRPGSPFCHLPSTSWVYTHLPRTFSRMSEVSCPKCFSSLAAQDILDTGNAMRTAGDVEAARHWYELGAANGDARAASNLGLLYRNEGSVELALVWSEIAAASGLPVAMFNLGCLYLDLGKNDLAVSWWERAATQGYPLAIANLRKLNHPVPV